MLRCIISSLHFWFKSKKEPAEGGEKKFNYEKWLLFFFSHKKTCIIFYLGKEMKKTKSFFHFFKICNLQTKTKKQHLKKILLPKNTSGDEKFFGNFVQRFFHVY